MALSNAANGLKITIDNGGGDSSASTPGAPLPVTIEGMTPAPQCSFGNTGGGVGFVVELNGRDIAYDLAETKPNSWYGKEQTDSNFGEYAFLYVSSDPAAPGKCFMSGTVASRTAGVRIVFKTHADGSMWASVLTADDFKDVLLADPPGAATPLPLDQLLVQGRQQESDVIDMMVVATREAVCGQAGEEPDCTINPGTLAPIRSQISFLMFQLNQILEFSQIDLFVRRVGPITFDQGDFTEQGYDSFQVLDDMIDCNLGNICELREENCADIVHLLPFERDSNGILGVASDIGPNPNAWSVITTLDDVPVALLVFTHEVGHMIVSAYMHTYVVACWIHVLILCLCIGWEA